MQYLGIVKPLDSRFDIFSLTEQYHSFVFIRAGILNNVLSSAFDSYAARLKMAV